MTQPQNLFIPADAGEKVTLPGIEITIKVTAASTGNAFAVFEEVTSPGVGPALHVHRHQFEIFRFLEGTVVVKYMGDTFLDLSCEKPPGHPHKRGSPIPLEGPQRKCLSAG
jgi:mannose-6-phosphate isomerase-like protein (cupin superfamily)